ncbi:MAG: hypothetical protein QM723_07105 [Myxococcaceae bacterium]
MNSTHSNTCATCGALLLVPVTTKRARSIAAAIRQCLDVAPMTVDELEHHLRVGHQSISARVHEMASRGVLVPIGTRPGRSGRPCRIWRTRTLAEQSAAAEGFAP